MVDYAHPSKNQSYVQYMYPEDLKKLDRNTWNVDDNDLAAGAGGGRAMYSVEPRHRAHYMCSGGRDPETRYLFNREKTRHPDFSSRFGYGRCPNGYCLGHFPGRYIVPSECGANPLPKNMAPSRFYTEEYRNQNSVNSQAIQDYTLATDDLMRLKAWWSYSS